MPQKKITVHLAAEEVEWLEFMARKKGTNRSRVVAAAVELYRVLGGLAELAEMTATAEDVINPSARPLSRLLRRSAVARWREELAG